MRPTVIKLSDYRKMLGPSGPLFAFIAPWIIVLICQTLALCKIIVPVYSSFYLIVVGNIFSILFLAFALQTFRPIDLSNTNEAFNITPRFKKLIYFFISFYLLCQIFQVIFFKGFPLLWLILKNYKTYFDYGIHSLNGFLNAIYLFSTTSLFLIYLKEKEKLKLSLLFFLLTIPILLVSRQLLVSVFLQIACCAIFYKPNIFKTILKYGFILIFTFIVIGNMRTGLQELTEILRPKEFVPTLFYPFLWIYAYIVTPFNNINVYIDYIRPVDAPVFELNALIPSVFRGYLGFENYQTGFSLVHENMTVSTFYLEPLQDFGRCYAFAFMALFQLFFLLAYRRAIKSKSPVHVIEYSIFYMIIILSIFSNLLLFLPVIAQLAIINLAKLKIFQKSHHWVFSIGKNI